MKTISPSGQPARDEAEPAAAERADHAARLLRDGAGARPRPVGGHTPSQIAEPVGQGGVERAVERAQLGVGLAVGARQGAPLGQGQERGRVLDGLRRLRKAG